MQTTINPAIVVVAFNRPVSLKRILTSLLRSNYPDSEVVLHISIDFSDSQSNKDVVEVATEFVWPYGPKLIDRQASNIGLKEHILKCGDLTNKYGSIIVLEDDLFVSKWFYHYSTLAVKYYDQDTTIGGISLYSYSVTEGFPLPFSPISDKYDVYFLQMASSWGQIWTQGQWELFRNWFKKNPEIKDTGLVPDEIVQWPDSSWKKHYINYLISTGRYFVYPRSSLSTNFGDSGTHMHRTNNFYQVPIELGERDYRFCSLEESASKYDAHFELDVELLKKLQPAFKDYDLTVDLYGKKNEKNVHTNHLVSSKKASKSITTFGLKLKPLPVNLIEMVPGNEISMATKDSFDFNSKLINSNFFQKIFEYYFGYIKYTYLIVYLKGVGTSFVKRKILK